MLNSLIFIISVIILFIGCAILFIDVVVSMKTDRCKIPIPAEYIGDDNNGSSVANKPNGFFVFAIPQFSYEFEGKKYEGKSANMFFHFYVKPGDLVVPFLNGKTYEIFVNPVQPNMYITSGEQRFTFIRMVGCAVALIGMILVLWAMRLPQLY